MQILVVEDKGKIANFLRRSFMEESYAVDIAHGGEETLLVFGYCPLLGVNVV